MCTKTNLRCNGRETRGLFHGTMTITAPPATRLETRYFSEPDMCELVRYMARFLDRYMSSCRQGCGTPTAPDWHTRVANRR